MGKPAARLGDMTMHGGSIVLGFPMVLIGGMPAARIGDMHVCPMVTPGTPPIPHVGGPITLGSPMVLIGGMPAARMGDMLVCVGPPDTIALGCPTVLIGEGGSGAASGGGAGFMGSAVAKASAFRAINGSKESTTKLEHWVEFEFVDKAGIPVSGVNYKLNDTESKESESVLRPDGRIRRDGIKQGQAKVQLFNISNAKWSKDKAEVGEKIKLSAEVEGFEDGTKATVEIYKRDIKGADAVIETIETEVKNKKVEGQWEYKYPQEEDENGNAEIKGYTSPEYYFEVIVGRIKTKSGLLSYKDWIEIELKDVEDNSIPNEEYLLYLSNGEVRKGKLNGNGYKKEEKLPPGYCNVKFINKFNVGSEADLPEDILSENLIKSDRVTENVLQEKKEWKLKLKIKCRYPKVQLSGTIEIKCNKSGGDLIHTSKREIKELDSFRAPVEEEIKGKEEGTFTVYVKGQLKRDIRIEETGERISITEEWTSKNIEAELKNGDEIPVEILIDPPDSLEVAGGHFWAYSYLPTKTNNKRGAEIILLFQPDNKVGNDGDTFSLIQTVKDSTSLMNQLGQNVKPEPKTSQLSNRTLTIHDTQGEDIGTGIDQEVLEEKRIYEGPDNIPNFRRRSRKALVVVNVDPRYSEQRMSEADPINTAGKSIILGSVKSAKKENGVWSGASLNDVPGLTIKLTDGTNGNVSGSMEFEVAAIHNNDKKFYGSVKWGWKMIGDDPVLDPPKVKVADNNRASNRFFKAATKWNATKIIDPATGNQYNPIQIPLV